MPKSVPDQNRARAVAIAVVGVATLAAVLIQASPGNSERQALLRHVASMRILETEPVAGPGRISVAGLDATTTPDDALVVAVQHPEAQLEGVEGGWIGSGLRYVVVDPDGQPITSRVLAVEQLDGFRALVSVCRGYSDSIKTAKLRALMGDTVVAELPLGDLPASPVALADPGKADERLRCWPSYNVTGSVLGEESIVFRLGRPVARDEIATVTIHRTTYRGPVVMGAVSSVPVYPGLDQASVPMVNVRYAKSVDVTVGYSRILPKHAEVTVPVELATRYGQPGFVVDRPVVVPVGADREVLLPRQDGLAKRPPKAVRRAASLTAYVRRREVGQPRMETLALGPGGIQVQGPDPATLGLESLRAGETVLMARGPVRSDRPDGPAKLELNVMWLEAVPGLSYRVVVPVESNRWQLAMPADPRNRRRSFGRPRGAGGGAGLPLGPGGLLPYRSGGPP